MNFVASRDFKLPLIILSSYYFKFLFQGCPKYTQKRERNNEVSGNSQRRRKEKRKPQIRDEMREFERLLQNKITANYLRRCVNVKTV